MGSINDDVDHGVVITEIKLRITEIWRACLFEANYLATYVRNSSSAPCVGSRIVHSSSRLSEHWFEDPRLRLPQTKRYCNSEPSMLMLMLLLHSQGPHSSKIMKAFISLASFFANKVF
jgi:hypothetical protein